MIARLCIGDEPVLEAIAHSEDGIGVLDTMKAATKLVLKDLTSAHFDESPVRSGAAPPLRERPESENRRRERPAILCNPDAPVSREIRFELARGFPVQDLVSLLLFPYAILVGTALFLEPGARQHLLVNAAYWLASFGGALWIHHRNERGRAGA